MMKELKHLIHRKKLRLLELFSLGQGSLRANLTKRYKCLRGDYTEDKVRLFSVVPSDQTRDNGH